MISISFQLTDSGLLKELQVEGHSGTALKGNDVVCAAVSVLVENLAASLQILLDLPVDAQAADGFFRVAIPEELLTPQTDILFSSVILGLKVISDNHPDAVQFVM